MADGGAAAPDPGPELVGRDSNGRKIYRPVPDPGPDLSQRLEDLDQCVKSVNLWVNTASNLFEEFRVRLRGKASKKQVRRLADHPAFLAPGKQALAVESLTTRVEYLESTLYTTTAQEVEPPDWATALRGEVWGVQKKLTEQMVELRGELAKAATQEQLNDAYQGLSDAGTEQGTWLAALHDKVMGLMRAKAFGKTGDYGEPTVRLDEEATAIRAFKDAVNELAVSRPPTAVRGVKYSLFKTFDAATKLVNQVPDRDCWAGYQPDAERVFSHLLEEAMKVSQWAAIAQSDYEKERGIDSPSDTLKAAAEDAARIAEEVARVMEARLGEPWETGKTMAPLLTATRALKSAVVHGAGIHYNPTKGVTS